MSGLNKVYVLGNLGKNPELKTFNDGCVANLVVATSEEWKGKDGQKQERVEWHRVVVRGKLAELCNQFLVKGSKVCVEGKLKTRSWDDNGTTHYTTEIIASNVMFLNKLSQREEPQADFQEF